MALAPYYDRLAPYVLVVTTVAAATVPSYSGPLARDVKLATVLAFLLAVLVVLLTGLASTWHAIERASNSGDAVIVLGGGLVAVLLGGVIIGRVLNPFAASITEHRESKRRAGTLLQDRGGLENAGLIIGWIERILLYGLFVAGAPDAAAVVLGVKSIARFPEFSDERFAEYYLIGSFLSLLIAAAIGLAVRAIIGLHPLIPTQL